MRGIMIKNTKGRSALGVLTAVAGLSLLAGCSATPLDGPEPDATASQTTTATAATGTPSAESVVETSSATASPTATETALAIAPDMVPPETTVESAIEANGEKGSLRLDGFMPRGSDELVLICPGETRQTVPNKAGIADEAFAELSEEAFLPTGSTMFTFAYLDAGSQAVSFSSFLNAPVDLCGTATNFGESFSGTVFKMRTEIELEKSGTGWVATGLV